MIGKEITGRVRLEVRTPTTPENLIANPTGEKGGWGWASPVAGSVVLGTNLAGVFNPGLVFRALLSQPTYFVSAPFAVTPGAYIGGRFNKEGTTPTGGTLTPTSRFEFLSSSGAIVSTSAAESMSLTNTAQTTTPRLVPAGAAFARLRFDISRGASNPAANDELVVSRVQVTTAATSAGITFGTVITPDVDAAGWTNIIGPAIALDIDRRELDVGTLSAVVRDATIDPAVAALLKSGREIRVLTRQDSLTWSVIFRGRITYALVQYDLLARTADTKKARITINASDPTAVLASTQSPNGVATVGEIPHLLEAASVPWTVITGGTGTSGHVPGTLARVSYNENASLLDQIAVTRDTARGIAYVRRDGTLEVRDAPIAVVYTTLDETIYGQDFEVGYDPRLIINEVTVRALGYALNEYGAEGTDVVLGVWRDQASINENGVFRRTFTVNTVPGFDAAAYANAILAANSKPTRRITKVRIPIRSTADLTLFPMIDVGMLLRITNTAKALDQTLRVNRVMHHMTEAGYYIELGFADVGSSAVPNTVPAPSPNFVNAMIDTPWTDLPLASGWSQYDAASWRAQYRRKNGEVKVRGLVVNGTAPTSVICTLPAGFRPLYNAIHPGMHSANAATWLYVYANGQVQMPGVPGTPSWQSVQMTFQAEQ